jgi:replicative DNA helicase
VNPPTLTPQNLEAERACVGSLLIDTALLGDVAASLEPSAFRSRDTRWVYEALLALHSQGAAIDLVTVGDELVRQGQLEAVGGTAYLCELMNVVPSALHLRSYVAIVQEMAERARLLETLGDAGKTAYAYDRPLGDAATQLRSWLQDYETGAVATTVAPVKEITDVLWERVADWREHPLRPGETRFPATGFAKLDEMTGGLRPGFYILAARASVGKTAMALSIATNLVKRGVPVDYITTEMTPLQLLSRLVSSLAKVQTKDVEAGRLTGEQHRRIGDALAEIEEWPLTVIAGLATLSGVEAHLRQTGAEVVFLDFLGTIDAPGDNRHLRLGAIARSILLTAQARELPIVTLHHLGRRVDGRPDKKPVLSDLYESGHLENTADGVWFLHRDGYYDPSCTHKIMQITVAKNRLAGNLGIADVQLNDYGLVDDVSPRPYEPNRTWEQEAF